MEMKKHNDGSHHRMSKTELTERLHTLQTSSIAIKTPMSLRETELHEVLHELEVYQIELEMQNRELREARIAVDESHDRYANLYDFAPTGYVTLTDEGLIKEINLTACRMLGIERRWLIGRSLSPWILPPELPLYRAHLRNLKKNRTSESNRERTIHTTLHLVRRDKSSIPVEFSSLCASDDGSKELLFKTSIIDLSERRKAEEDRDRFFNLSVDLLCIAGADGYFKRLNPAWEAVLGHRSEELLSRPFLEFIHPDDRDSTLLEVLKLQKSDVIVHFQNRFLKNDRSYLWLSWSAVSAENTFYCVARDTTMDIQSKEAVRNSLSKLEEERELRETFVSAVSHDLRTPITTAKLSAQLLIRSAHEPSVLQRLSGRIIENMDRADHMIRDLLDANRIKAGQAIALNLKEVNLISTIQLVIDELSAIHGPQIELLDATRISGTWDVEAIQRVLENLLSNALKYGSKGTPITVSVKRIADEVQIAVHNEGDPISPEDQKTVFQQFKRTQSSQVSGQKGWGIGLTLVKGLVEAHGGCIDLLSAPDQGTTFIVRLPIAS